ncbi:glycine-rich domain-containing protein [Bradyrhizobium sp. USDA 4502]
MDQLGPLGLLESVDKSISQQLRDKLTLLQDVDLNDEKTSYLNAYPGRAIQVHLIEKEMKRFLSLNLLVQSPRYSFVPSLPVDDMWHFFILNTPKYRRTCNNVFGQYVDHEPAPGGKSQGLAAAGGEIAGYTKECLKQFYGHIPAPIWGYAAGCDTVAPCAAW